MRKLTPVSLLVILMLPFGASPAHAQLVSLQEFLARPSGQLAGSAEPAQDSPALRRVVSLRLHQVPLLPALQEISRQAGLRLMFSEPTLPEDQRISLRAERITVAEAAARVLSGTNLKLVVMPNGQAAVVPMRPEERAAQLRQGVVAGRVADALTQEPLANAEVMVVGTGRGTLTAPDGRFQVEAVPAGTHRVRVSIIGYAPEEQSVTVTEGATVTTNFELDREVVALEGIVAVGYGTQRRRDVTGAISSVQAEEIQQIPTTHPIDAIKGRVAGVDVVAANHAPGAEVRVRIRGERSINASNDPLYVVDGVAISGSLNDIPVNDIESMEVLKDASATAIYGSRGANGVVLITTRSGKRGATRLTYDSYVGAQTVINEVPVFNGEEFAELRREAYRGAGQTVTDEEIFFPVELESIAQGRSTDWIGLTRRTGMQQNHNVGVNWGDEQTRFASSVNWLEQEGVTRGEGFERTNFRVNLDHDASSRLRLGASLQLSRSFQDLNSGVLPAEMRENSPLGIPYDAEGNLVFKPTPDGVRVNPLTEIENVHDERLRTRAFGNIFAEYELADGLRWRAMLGPDVSLARRGRALGAFTQAMQGSGSEALIQEQKIYAYTLDNVVTFQRELSEDHQVNATLLYSVQEERAEYHNSEVADLPYDHQLFYNLDSAGAVKGIGSELQEWTLQSYMGRLNYDFRSRYLLTLTGRIDGSSRLAEGNKYGFFPSVAVGWRLSEEPFLRDNGLLSELKLRVSYGRTGNTAISPYMTQGQLARTLYSTAKAPAYGHKPDLLENPDLEWEKTTQLDVGVDLGVLENRISASVDFYRAHTEDLLLQRQLPPTSGFSSVLENIGDTRNSGVELSLSTINVQRGDFRWMTELSWSRNRNRIVNLYGDREDDAGNGWFIGQPIEVWYDHEFDGIWQLGQEEEAARYRQKPGEIRVVDQNGDGAITAADRVIIGTPFPDWFGGLSNEVEWGSFDFSAFVAARQGSTLFSNFNAQSLQGRFNTPRVDYWTPTNPSNTAPRPNSGQQFAAYNDSRAYQDGSFIRVRNVTLGYSVPDRLAARLGAGSLRIYGSAQDPFVFTNYTGYDPETGTAQSPSYRTLLLGLNLGF